MAPVPDRISTLDLTLFEAIHSESTDSDKLSLLHLQNCIRSGGDYSYLEIGSYMGGSLQPYYADSVCTRIYSIDKRPAFMPDERGRLFSYPRSENSTQAMLANLSRAFLAVSGAKVQTFDCDAGDLDPAAFGDRPRLCFIDGEHTAGAAYSDFRFCLKVVDQDGIIAFHDADVVFNAIMRAESELSAQSIKFKGMVLGGCVYAILLNGAVEACSARLQRIQQDREQYFRKASEKLARIRSENRHNKIGKLRDWLSNYPRLYDFLRETKGVVTRGIDKS